VTSATGPHDPFGPPRPAGPSSWPDTATRPDAATPVEHPATHPDDRPAVRHAEHSHLAPPPAPRHRRRPWAVVILSVLLALVTALASYLWVRTVRYEEYAAGIEAQGRAIGTELATLRTQHDGTLAELDAVNEQLSTAQSRITQLADEKAQVGDDREVQRQLVDYQERISQAAANVASALSTCIDAQNQLITYLENAQAYDPADLQRFKSDVQGVCNAATVANTELQRQLAAGATG
jgi:signal transduction histidine kinase